MLLYKTVRLLSSLLQLMSYVLMAYWLVSLVAPRSPLADWMRRVLEPFLAPFRKLSRMAVLRWGAPFDFTIFFAMIGVNLAGQLLWPVYRILVKLF